MTTLDGIYNQANNFTTLTIGTAIIWMSLAVIKKAAVPNQKRSLFEKIIWGQLIIVILILFATLLLQLFGVKDFSFFNYK